MQVCTYIIIPALLPPLGIIMPTKQRQYVTDRRGRVQSIAREPVREAHKQTNEKEGGGRFFGASMIAAVT
jgi:hypothetical protein